MAFTPVMDVQPCAIYALTPRGALLARKISAFRAADLYFAASLRGHFSQTPQAEDAGLEYFDALGALLRQNFRRYSSHIFIAATGIVVRCLAPLLSENGEGHMNGKTRSPAVLVLDQNGSFVISLLSGHLGGANALARELAAFLGAAPVITTATDCAALPSMDLLARTQGLEIENLPAVKSVNSALLRGEHPLLYDPQNLLGLAGTEQEALFTRVKAPAELSGQAREIGQDGGAGQAQAAVFVGPEAFGSLERLGLNRQSTLFLHSQNSCPQSPQAQSACPQTVCRQNLCLGLGCKRGVSVETLFAFVAEQFLAHGLSLRNVSRIASFEGKRDEAALHQLAKLLGVPLRFFSAGELAECPGPSYSPKAREVFGLNGVCESAALRAAGAIASECAAGVAGSAASAASGGPACSGGTISGGRLLVPKQRGPGVTLAIAVSDIITDHENCSTRKL